MGRHVWSEEVKAQALELLTDPARTFYEVRAETGVPVGTLHGWATQAGLERSDDQTKEASDRRRLRLSSKREVIAEEFLDRAEDLMGRMDLPHVVGYNDGEAIVLPYGASADCKNYMTAAAIAFDKFRLEMGEATSRTEDITASPRDRIKGRVDELESKRQQRTA